MTTEQNMPHPRDWPMWAGVIITQRGERPSRGRVAPLTTSTQLVVNVYSKLTLHTEVRTFAWESVEHTPELVRLDVDDPMTAGWLETWRRTAREEPT